MFPTVMGVLVLIAAWYYMKDLARLGNKTGRQEAFNNSR